MSRDVLHKTYELFPDAVRLIPFGLGEPLLYPYFWELIETAKRHDVPVCFNTNGTVLTPQRAEARRPRCRTSAYSRRQGGSGNV